MEITKTFDLLVRYQEKFPDKNDALAAKRDGKWVKYSTEEYIKNSYLMSYGLLELGLKREDKIVTVLNNCPEWNFIDMGAAMIGVVHAPVFTSLSTNDYSYILEHSEAKIIFVSDDQLYKKVKPAAEQIKGIVSIYSIEEVQDVKSWKEIIGQLINENGLKHEIAAVKIIATRGSRAEPPYDHGIVVIARPYTPLFACENNPGLKLVTYPHPRCSPLADYKTLNYLYYHLAGKWAVEQGADEALILNPDRTISETNRANILLIRGKKIIKPSSPHVLAGIMEEKVCQLLLSWGYDLLEEKFQPEDLFDADNVMITNSLIGALPVVALDGKEMKSTPDLCKKINDLLL